MTSPAYLPQGPEGYTCHVECGATLAVYMRGVPVVLLTTKVEIIRTMVCDQAHTVVSSRGQQLAAHLHKVFYIKFY